MIIKLKGEGHWLQIKRCFEAAIASHRYDPDPLDLRAIFLEAVEAVQKRLPQINEQPPDVEIPEGELDELRAFTRGVMLGSALYERGISFEQGACAPVDPRSPLQ